MPLMPKRVKFRKSQRGKIKGNATRGNTVAFGEYGLQALKPSWITARQIEAGRVAANPLLPRGRRMFLFLTPPKKGPPPPPHRERQQPETQHTHKSHISPS